MLFLITKEHIQEYYQLNYRISPGHPGFFHQNNKPEEASSESGNSGDSANEIMKFKCLLDLGAITQEEFDAKKKELLGL